jgi:hypothetical protein
MGIEISCPRKVRKMIPKPRSNNDKSKSEAKNDCGDVALFREVSYWV